MKNLLAIILLFCVTLFLGSCTKEAPNQGGQNPFYVPGNTNTSTTGEPEPEPTPTTPLSIVTENGQLPMDFTKKVLLEEFTGEWCGFCPTGQAILATEVANNPGQLIVVGIHQNDIFSNNNAWYSALQPYWYAGSGQTSVGFPGGAVDRTAQSALYPGAAYYNRNEWSAAIAANIGNSPECGLAIVPKLDGTTLDVQVYVGHHAAITKDTRLTIVIIENDVPESSVGQQSGAPDGYFHQHLLRKEVTDIMGESIDLSAVTADKYVMKEFKGIDVSSVSNLQKAHIVAFISKHGSTGADLGILNAQESSLSEVKKFD